MEYGYSNLTRPIAIIHSVISVRYIHPRRAASRASDRTTRRDRKRAALPLASRVYMDMDMRVYFFFYKGTKSKPKNPPDEVSVFAAGLGGCVAGTVRVRLDAGCVGGA